MTTYKLTSSTPITER